jgi:hypothetical protein
VRGDLPRVTQIAFAATVGLELQQVDHHDRGVCPPRRERRELLGRRGQRHRYTHPLTSTFGGGVARASLRKTFTSSTPYELAARMVANMSIVAASARHRG